MVQGRIEVTPEEQLQGLREARDRYVALADRLRDGADIQEIPEKKLELERDARRIANAYEKSIANSIARTAGARQARLFALPSLSAGMWLTIFVVISAAEGAALLAIFRPAIFQTKLAQPPPAAAKVNLAALLPIATAQIPTPPARHAEAPSEKGARMAAPAAIAAPTARPAGDHPPAIRMVQPVQPTAVPPAFTVQQEAPSPIAAVKQPPPLSAAVIPKANVQQEAPAPIVPVRQVPPPSDPAKPPPAAVAAEISVPQQAPPPTTNFVLVAPPKPAAPVPPPIRLEPIAYTHLLPPYPTISKRLGEQGTTQMQVTISTQGLVTDCKTTKSSGSVRLDTAACTFVQGHWRWKPPTRAGQPVTADERVSVIWNLEDTR